MTDLSWLTIVVALLGLTAAALVARSTNRKSDREGADSISAAAVRLVAPLEARLEAIGKENEILRVRQNALEAESRELETLRFENHHLKERINQLEVRVEMLRSNSVENDDLLKKLLIERERSSTLLEAVGVLAGQVISLGGEPIVKLGEYRVE